MSTQNEFLNQNMPCEYDGHYTSVSLASGGKNLEFGSDSDEIDDELNDIDSDIVSLDDYISELELQISRVNDMKDELQNYKEYIEAMRDTD